MTPFITTGSPVVVCVNSIDKIDKIGSIGARLRACLQGDRVTLVLGLR